MLAQPLMGLLCKKLGGLQLDDRERRFPILRSSRSQDTERRDDYAVLCLENVGGEGREWLISFLFLPTMHPVLDVRLAHAGVPCRILPGSPGGDGPNEILLHLLRELRFLRHFNAVP